MGMGENIRHPGLGASEESDLQQTKNAQAQPPIETGAIQVTRQAHVAAGAKSILKAAAFLREPGLVRGIAALSRLNQFGGVDCPGCAWPDPD